MTGTIFDPLVFFASLYGFIGGFLAFTWLRLINGAPISPPVPRWKKAIGMALYFCIWPVLVASDLIEAYLIERRMRAAYRKRGAL